MTFFSRWEPGHCIVLCVDTPDSLRVRLEQSLATEQGTLDLSDPFALHIPLLDQIIILYDQSVWGIRDLIRRVEKVLLSSGHANKATMADGLSCRVGKTIGLPIQTSPGCTKFPGMQPIPPRYYL
jgi:hypothetical protein